MTRDDLEFVPDGVEIRPAVLSAERMTAIRAQVSVDHEILRRTGIRNLEKKFRCIADTAADSAVLSIAESLLGKSPKLVRALFFDKTDYRNWFVAWHQDRTVTLNRRVELQGWGAWSQKDNVHHVQPPRLVLDHIVTIRLHLDDASAESGCLSVIPGSHKLGILDENAIGRAVLEGAPKDCIVRAGDAVVMHPLILHSSARSRSAGHRRVVHLEYSSYALPSNVAWA